MKGIERFSTLLEGFLPNQIAWDAKPAFVFWWFGGAIELFGKTIPAVSLLPMWLLLSAYLLYRATFFITNSRLSGRLRSRDAYRCRFVILPERLSGAPSIVAYGESRPCVLHWWPGKKNWQALVWAGWIDGTFMA